MEATLLTIFAVYAVGVLVAFAVSSYFISRYRTKDNPIVGALFSWFTVLIALIIVPIIKLFKRYPDERIY